MKMKEKHDKIYFIDILLAMKKSAICYSYNTRLAPQTGFLSQ